MQKQSKALELTLMSAGAAILCISAMISIPTAVPFTLQTMAVALLLTALGGRRGTIAIAVYLLLGAIGLPVFSGFNGGISALLGATGGYLTGFLLMGLCYWAFEDRRKAPQNHPTAAANVDKKKLRRSAILRTALGLGLGLLVCYAFGTLWFMRVYAGGTTLGKALSLCVLPFLLPDAVKLTLGAAAGLRIRRQIL